MPVNRRSLILSAVGAGAGGLAGCLTGRTSTDLADLEEWPPPERNDRLEFWTWQQYWGNQAIAFQHAADLESIERETLPAPEQYRRLADGDTPDAVHFRSRQFERAVRDELLEPLPVDGIPSWPPNEELREHGLDFYERDGQYYGLPQTPLAYALAYHGREFDDPDTWGLLWEESLEGRISMPADPVLTGQIAALYTGQDPNDPRDFEEIREVLANQHPLVDEYWTDWLECWRKFEHDDYLASVLPYPRMCLCSEDGTPIVRVAPDEGVLYSQNTFAVPAGAANPYASLEFIEWGSSFKTGTEASWEADEWELHLAGSVDSEIRDSFVSIAEDVGVEPGSGE